MPTMLVVSLYAILFCGSTVVSILLTGSRAFLGRAGSGASAVLGLVFDWHFIAAAVFAFASRLIFVLMNQTLYRDPDLSRSSTTLTTLISGVATIAVVVANVAFLGERLTARQVVGSAVVLGGVVLLTAK